MAQVQYEGIRVLTNKQLVGGSLFLFQLSFEKLPLSLSATGSTLPLSTEGPFSGAGDQQCRSGLATVRPWGRAVSEWYVHVRLESVNLATDAGVCTV
ncbi:hypothetical protein ACOMHN_008341 [Nucella lapillus]